MRQTAVNRACAASAERLHWISIAAAWLLLLPAAQPLFGAQPPVLEPGGFQEAILSSEQHQSPQGRRSGGGERGVYKSRIEPHWFDNGRRFWYRNDLSGNAREFILVDAEQGRRQRAFDHGRLAAALSKASGQDFTGEHLPFLEIEFSAGGDVITFDAADKHWTCDLSTYECAAVLAQSEARNVPEVSAATGQRAGRGSGRRGGGPSVQSPDGKWRAYVRNQNVHIRAVAAESDASGGEEVALSTDGEDGNAYGRLEWSPDSKRLLAWRIEPGDRKMVYLIRSSPPDGGRAQLESRPYALPGDKFSRYELNLFDVTARSQVKPQVDRFEHEWLAPEIHWAQDGHHFEWQQEDRGHQRFRVFQVDSRNGDARELIDERTKTFIWTAHMEGPERLGVRIVTYLRNSDEIIYASERDGWRHLYLVDPGNEPRAVASPNVPPVEEQIATGTGVSLKQITRGDWVVRGIERIDEEKRQIWFLASGMNANQDPYFIHYYRINFDGTGLVALTEGDGTHTVQFSPDRKYIIDTYSRVDMAPVNELRRTSDGRLVCKLEESDISELKAGGWEPPEVFVAKGRDGKTDIWGIICRPQDFDPGAKYPILEDVYAGPQDSYTPKSFSAARRYEAYNRLGFVVVKLDGMGTANRSKAFHDVCWHNLKDGGFPDRIPWIQAAAKKYPSLDSERVGVFGTSAGGQNAAAAVLFHPEFYKVAVANCGCHDNRMDKASWNEQWMGYMAGDKIWEASPENWYSQSSNIDNASKLKGRLFLIVGEMDSNVPPESTLRFANALIQAGKDFDMLVVPGANHGANSRVTAFKTQDFFVRHLLGKEPPNRNNESRGARVGNPNAN